MIRMFCFSIHGSPWFVHVFLCYTVALGFIMQYFFKKLSSNSAKIYKFIDKISIFSGVYVN